MSPLVPEIMDELGGERSGVDALDSPEAFDVIDLLASPDAIPFPRFEAALTANVREGRLLNQAPWVRSLGRLEMVVHTEGWKFPAPPPELDRPPTPTVRREPKASETTPDSPAPALPDAIPVAKKDRIRTRPTADTVLVKDRLLYLLQPPLDGLFDGRQMEVPFEPFPYQLEGIAFFLPRHAALLADEMGLGKTAQAILSLRLLFHQGMIRHALIVCPKPLVHNWCRELKLWAPDLPFEVFPTDPDLRRTAWKVSNCPVKIVNYESLTRDADVAADPNLFFDVVVIDEAQRIKNADSKTALAVKGLHRARSWALTGTPIENSVEDLINIFAFVDPGRIPPDTPAKRVAHLTSDCILRRTKDVVQSDMPPRIFRDLNLELSPAQQYAYERAENEGVIQLNELGDTLSVQHVFQLVMRLKQICNFDPLTGDSAKLQQLLTDMEEVAANGRKAIIFSQWVEPLQMIADAMPEHNPLQYHGRIPQNERTPILDEFKQNPDRRVLLMSYGSGSVGLNLQFTNYVFLFDRWWNPAIEDQAINRAHRIGQRYPVTVTRFLAENTIETRIASILDAKRAMFNELIANAEKPASLGLSEDEIFGLFDIRNRPKKAAA